MRSVILDQLRFQLVVGFVFLCVTLTSAKMMSMMLVVFARHLDNFSDDYESHSLSG